MEAKIVCLGCQNSSWRKGFLPVSVHPVTLLRHAMCPECALKFEVCPACNKSVEQAPFEKEVIMQALDQSIGSNEIKEAVFQEQKIEIAPEETFVDTEEEKLQYLTYEELLKPPPYRKEVDLTKKEQYLSERRFVNLFGMDKPAFDKLPKWKQTDLRKKFKLF